MVTKKKPAKKAAKKVALKKAAGKKVPAKRPAKKSAAKKAAPAMRKVNVGRLDQLRHDLKKWVGDLRAAGQNDLANKIEDVRLVVHQVFCDIIGGPGNGPDPNKLISVR